MKIFKTLIVVTGLLSSAQAMACSVEIRVFNHTGVTLDAVSINGPFYGESNITYDMIDQGYSRYLFSHADDGLLGKNSCQGVYELDFNAGKPHCDIDESVDNYSADFSSGDGTANFTIEKAKNGNMCTISLVKG